MKKFEVGKIYGRKQIEKYGSRYEYVNRVKKLKIRTNVCDDTEVIFFYEDLILA